jgi:hypothetical protein
MGLISKLAFGAHSGNGSHSLQIVSLSPEYQIGRAIPSAGGEIYVEWNQLVRGVLKDCGLDRVWGDPLG